VGTVKFEGLTKGKYDIVVSYDGDEKYLKSSASTSISVTRCTANIEIIADDINCGESLTVGVKLPSDVTRRAKVTIDDVSKFVILKEGVGSVKFDGLAKGKHTITVTYDPKYTDSTHRYMCGDHVYPSLELALLLNYWRHYGYVK
jgi:hypothetical protein